MNLKLTPPKEITFWIAVVLGLLGLFSFLAHLQNIFAKFNLRSSKELRLVLKDWNFAEWWEQNQQA